MNDQPIRKLAVLLHADVVSSTELVQIDEITAHQRMQDAFRRLTQKIADHNGIAHEVRGDALVAEFPRASDAVAAASEFQAENCEYNLKLEDDVRPQLRIGIAIGEVVIADNTVTGEGIVMAQRLEQLAEPNGICVQGAAVETMPKRMTLDFQNLGECLLKGFAEPIRAFSIKPPLHSPSTPKSERQLNPSGEDLTGTSKMQRPSIAVLPLTNMSGDPEQTFFSDGITEDIITELSRFSTLSVVARHSSFALKGETTNIKQIGEALAAQYVVEGSVRRAENRVRITVQLVETESGNHIWAERYDRDLEDIFAVQDEVTSSIVAVLVGRVQENIVDRALRRPTDNVRAYELMLQGKSLRDGLNAKDMDQARQVLEKAIKLDPRYARAHMYLSDTLVIDLWLGLASEGDLELAYQLALKAVELDGNDVFIQDHLGYAYLCKGYWEEANTQFEKTLSKIVNEAESLAWTGYAFLLMGHHQKALDIVLEASRLDPLHPRSFDWILGQVFLFNGRAEDTVRVLHRDSLLNSLGCATLVCAYAELGREHDSRIALEHFVDERHREFGARQMAVEDNSITSLAGGYRKMWRHQADWERIADGLRAAGLTD
jgi:adenylate cyclase